MKVKELELEGKAAVLKILPCPPIQGGEGQVVTGTFRHTSDSLVELQIEGEPEPIVCTSGHLIWSEDRREFVEASELRVGEGLRYAFRQSRLQSLNRIGSERIVRNIEVAQTHVYMVGAQGILVHNAGVSCDDDPGSSNKTASGFKGSKGFELVNHPLQSVRNVATTVNGRSFSGHALDQMQNRGIPPSVVQNAIERGVLSVGNKPGTQVFTDKVNKIRVVINSTTGNVITVIPGT